jgi:hypothetical protein
MECGGHGIEVLTRCRIWDLIEGLDCEVNLHCVMRKCAASVRSFVKFPDDIESQRGHVVFVATIRIPSGKRCCDIGSPRTSRRFLGKERRRISQKIPLLLHSGQLKLECQKLLVSGSACTRESLLATHIQFTSPSVQLISADTHAPGDLINVHPPR